MTSQVGATNVARVKVISVNFGTEMDASSINTSTFIMKQTGVSVQGTVSILEQQAVFIPTAVLAATLYTATLTTGVKKCK
jgi:hypothetical protein